MTTPATPADWADALRSRGLSADAARGKAPRFATAVRLLNQSRAEPDTGLLALFVPGRIEVLGKHTDYAGGRSLLAAAERGFCLVGAPRRDNTVRITDAAINDAVQFVIDDQLKQELPAAGHWSNYPMTVARRIARNFDGPLRGADMVFSNDIPRAAGMSGSSAFIVGVFLLLSDVNDLSKQCAFGQNIDGPESLAGYLGTIENGQSFGTLSGDAGVGTFGGSEDHTAILCCRPGVLSQYSYCPVRFERAIDMPEGHVFVIASSGMAAEKTGRARDAYNRASRLAVSAAEVWRRQSGRDDPHLAAAIASDPDAPLALRDVLRRASGAGFSPEELLSRFEHFLSENEQIIPAAGDALARGDLAEFGRQVDRSQDLAEALLGNQVEQTAALAHYARELGAAAASGFGAGFGGSVWALVPAESADVFLTAWRDRYAERFPDTAADATFFPTAAGPATFQLK